MTKTTEFLDKIVENGDIVTINFNYGHISGKLESFHGVYRVSNPDSLVAFLEKDVDHFYDYSVLLREIPS